jgi:hypothetical protein
MRKLEISEDTDIVTGTTPIKQQEVAVAPSGVLKPVVTPDVQPVIPDLTSEKVIWPPVNIPEMTPAEIASIAALSNAGGYMPDQDYTMNIVMGGGPGTNQILQAPSIQLTATQIATNNILNNIVAPGDKIAALSGNDSAASVVVAAAITNELNTNKQIPPAVADKLAYQAMILAGSAADAAAKPDATVDDIQNAKIASALMSQALLATAVIKQDVATTALKNSVSQSEYAENAIVLKAAQNLVSINTNAVQSVDPANNAAASEVLAALQVVPTTTSKSNVVNPNLFNRLIEYIYNKLYAPKTNSMELIDNIDETLIDHVESYDYSASQLMTGARIDDINNAQARDQSNTNMPTKARHFKPPYIKYGLPNTGNFISLAARQGMTTNKNPEIMATDITLSKPMSNQAVPTKRSMIPFIK